MYQAGINYLLSFVSCTVSVLNCKCLSHYYVHKIILHLAISWLAHVTVKTYLAAIRYLQISQDLPEPRADSMPKLSLVLRGIQRSKTGSAGKPRLPTSPTILRQLKALWAEQAMDFDTIFFGMIAAQLSLFFSGWESSLHPQLPVEGLLTVYQFGMWL